MLVAWSEPVLEVSGVPPASYQVAEVGGQRSENRGQRIWNWEVGIRNGEIVDFGFRILDLGLRNGQAKGNAWAEPTSTGPSNVVVFLIGSF